MRSNFAGWSLVLIGLVACQRERPKPVPPAESATAKPQASAPRPAPSAASVERDEPLDAGASRDASASENVELDDIGPAGPATATARGVVMITRDGEVRLVALQKKPKTPLEPVPFDAGSFSPFARGPAVAGDFAYWISEGRLIRKPLTGSREEVLTEDARDGTRVAAGLMNGQPLVAYIARPASADADATARLWTTSGATLRLSPEGAAASSVALVDTPAGTMALTLEGRSGMSPVHARRVIDPRGKVALDPDVVVWIGGSSQSLTEVVGAPSPSGEVWGFAAIERDVTGFGLAAIQVGERPKMGAPVTWRMYPNGLDPAPVTTAHACGESWLAYARPADAKPGSTQELHLAAIGAGGLGPSRVIARSKAFANASLSAAGEGILLAFTADHRTWAARIRCNLAAPSGSKTH